MMRKNLQKGIGFVLSVVLILVFSNSVSAQPAVAMPDGFAEGTTGGGQATPVTVNSAAELRTHGESGQATVVYVGSNINLGTTPLRVGSNTTIVGLSSDVTITGCIVISGRTNVIIQNLNITNPNKVATGDGIEVRNSTSVFITKCTFDNCADGSIDIVRSSDFVTISWCRFKYTSQTTHNFANLIGNGDIVFEDRGKLRVTMHHNWWDNGSKQRMPRVRFGQVHVYNNYYGAANNDYNIGVGNESQILVESSYFDSQKSLWSNFSTSTTAQGIIQWRNLHLVNSSIPGWAPNSTVFVPPYTYEMDDVADVKAIVMEGAGNVHGVPSAINENSMRGMPVVHQNPVSGGNMVVYLNDFSGSAIVRLVNLTGQTVVEKVVFNAPSVEIPIDGQQGIYILSVASNNDVYTQKVKVIR